MFIEGLCPKNHVILWGYSGEPSLTVSCPHEALSLLEEMGGR